MIVPDVNLLLYAYDTSSRDHARARDWWEQALSATETVGLAWVTLLGFLRIATHPRVFSAPMDVEEASSHVSAWLARSCVRALEPGFRHWTILSDLLRGTRAAANLTTDAHLAALALEHGGVVFSSDMDFRRFEGVRLVNPLTR